MESGHYSPIIKSHPDLIHIAKHRSKSGVDDTDTNILCVHTKDTNILCRHIY